MPRATRENAPAQELSYVAGACFAAGTEAWTRSWEIGRRHLMPPGALPSLADYRHCATEMATVPWLTLARLGAELRAPDRPAPAAAEHEVLGKRLRLPIGIRRATQGLALYAVDAEPVHGDLQAGGGHFQAVDLGRQRTAVALSGVHYEESGLGSYDEIYLAYLVTPRGDATAIGLHIAACPVSDPFACEAGRALWGYPKSVEPVTFTPQAQAATWHLAAPGGGGVAVTFAPGGGGGSADVPITSYTMLGGHPHVTTLTHTGRHERIRSDGGAVALTVEGEGARPRLGYLLRRLGLASARPFLSVWTGQMSGAFGAPRRLE
jgi:hypothetical protein